MTDGVLNVYKEKGMTSFSVVSRIKRALNVSKTGHTGTLDPDATGVLPVCIGKATKLVDYLMDTDKVYHAVMLLGKKTDTQDITGRITEEMTFNQVYKLMGFQDLSLSDFEAQKKASDRINAAFKLFTGSIEQVPPMYSAVKIKGIKSVDAARRGIELERRPRPVTIYGFENIEYGKDGLHISFDVRCSKGTYVRTLCQDIGGFLGIPACMESLVRTRTAGLSVSDSIRLEEIISLARDNMLDSHIIPIDSFLGKYEALTFKDNAVKKVIVGNYLYNEDIISTVTEENIYRMYDTNGKFYALYRFCAEEECFKTEKMFV